jgi:hypothetical protein
VQLVITFGPATCALLFLLHEWVDPEWTTLRMEQSIELLPTDLEPVMLGVEVSFFVNAPEQRVRVASH